MLSADLVRCAAQAVLAAALTIGRPSLWLFVAVALVVGTGNAFVSPALSGFPVQLLPPAMLADANALLGSAQPAAQVAGPAVAGLLIAVTSPALVIAVDAGSYALSALALARLRLPRTSEHPGQPTYRARSLSRELAEGWSEFTAHTWLWPRTVQFALFNLVTWGPYLVLGPVLAGQYLGGARAWGTILACYGGGAVLGGLLALGRRPARPLLVSTLTTFGYALPPLALALHLPLPAVAAAALAAGLGTAFGGAFNSTVNQRLIPAEALSRVGAFNMVGAFAFGPVAFAAAGPVAAAVGARAVLAFGAAWSVATTLAVLTVPAIRHQPWPDPKQVTPTPVMQTPRTPVTPAPLDPRDTSPTPPPLHQTHPPQSHKPHGIRLVRLDVPGALPVFGHVCPGGRIFGPCGTQARFSCPRGTLARFVLALWHTGRLAVLALWHTGACRPSSATGRPPRRPAA
jgi:hypothetical protein